MVATARFGGHAGDHRDFADAIKPVLREDFWLAITMMGAPHDPRLVAAPASAGIRLE